MTSILFGENAKLTAPASERERFQKFYRDVLGCRVTPKPEADIVRLGPGLYMAVVYGNSAFQ